VASNSVHLQHVLVFRLFPMGSLDYLQERALTVVHNRSPGQLIFSLKGLSLQQLVQRPMHRQLQTHEAVASRVVDLAQQCTRSRVKTPTSSTAPRHRRR
jgi:hypothetical protein